MQQPTVHRWHVTVVAAALLLAVSAHANGDSIVVSVGNETILIPVPDGYSAVDQASTEANAESWAIGRRLLALMVHDTERSTRRTGKASNGFLYVESLDKFTNGRVSSDAFAALKQRLRDGDAWVGDVEPINSSSDSILFATAAHDASGNQTYLATAIMHISEQVIVLNCTDTKLSHTDVHRLMDTWQSACRTMNSAGGRAQPGNPTTTLGPVFNPTNTSGPLDIPFPPAGSNQNNDSDFGNASTSSGPYILHPRRGSYSGPNRPPTVRRPPKSMPGLIVAASSWLLLKIGIDSKPVLIGIGIAVLGLLTLVGISAAFTRKVPENQVDEGEGADDDTKTSQSGNGYVKETVIEGLSDLLSDDDE